jgi:hypothetical protein
LGGLGDPSERGLNGIRGIFQWGVDDPLRFKIVTLVGSPVGAPGVGSPSGRQELAAACGCEVRTVQRDLALLAEAGIPIEYDVRRKTYRLPEKGWTFPVASLTAEDALALALLRGLA